MSFGTPLLRESAIVLTFLGMAVGGAFADGNTQCGCCPTSHTLKATHVVSGVKTGTHVLGEMTTPTLSDGGGDVTSMTLFYAWPTSPTMTLFGGTDADVCVHEDGVQYDQFLRGTTVTVSWSGPGSCPPMNDRVRAIHDLPKPADGVVDTYNVEATASDCCECNAGPESKSAGTTLKVYWPYMQGLPPTGEIVFPKPFPRDFSLSPVWAWRDQIVLTRSVHWTCWANASDEDFVESDLFSVDSAPTVRWDDGTVIDSPGTTDVVWTSSNGELEYGYRVELESPAGGCPAGIPWTLRLSVDDNCLPPEYADDPEVSPADESCYYIYRHHLDRDFENLGSLLSHNIRPTNHCFGAATHAYSGVDADAIPPWGNDGRGRIIYRAVDNPDIPPWLDETTTTQYAHGAVLHYSLNCDHVVTCLGGNDSVWEFNGRINPARWGTSTVSAVIRLVNENGNRVVKKIEYFPPPEGY